MITNFSNLFNEKSSLLHTIITAVPKTLSQFQNNSFQCFSRAHDISVSPLNKSNTADNRSKKSQVRTARRK